MPQQNPMHRGASVVMAVAIIAAPVGCSSSASKPAGHSEQSSIRIAIDGQPRTVQGKVVCVDGPTGEVSIEVDTTTPDPVVVLDLTPQGDAPSVSLLTINLPDIGLSTGRYRTSGAPTATKAGNTYTVKGQATVVGTPPKSPQYRAFELELTCP